jgi:hydrogenase nickel incorporation protein HypA/HybF
MHELSLLWSVRETLEEQALKHKFSKVTQITLEIGRLACVETDALRFCFDAVMKDSLAANAELVILETAGLGICRQCRKQSEMESFYSPCKHCGSLSVELIQGIDMRIKDLLVI